MSFFVLLKIIIVALSISSCVHHQETIKEGTIHDTTNDTIALNNQEQDIPNENVVEQECDCSPNPYASDIECDPNIFRKIENGDTNAFELYYNYSAYTYNRGVIINVIKYSLLLAEKHHYIYGYNRAYESYVRLYEIDGSLSDTDKKKLVSYCWKSYHIYNDIAAMYRLRSIYRGDLDSSLRDIEQYKLCDSIINHWKEKNHKHKKGGNE